MGWFWLIVIILVVGFLLVRRSRRKGTPGSKSKTAQQVQRATRMAEPSKATRPTRGLVSPAGMRPMSNSAEDSGRNWVACDQAVDVLGLTLGGGIYVGREMTAANGYSPEPALVNPYLAVDWKRPIWDGSGMGYWPSYSGIGPGHRAAYLHWLASGQDDPGAYIGYVFLYFYGLERRALVDFKANKEARSELPAILSRVRSLLDTYGTNNSFHHYASGFLGVGSALSGNGDYLAYDPPLVRSHWEEPPQLKFGLGTLAARGLPIPETWALSWLVHHPNIYLRTPAIRCPDEFLRLFAIKYEEKFGTGMVVKPGKTKLRVGYRPASAGFSGEMQMQVGSLPDVTTLSAPLKALHVMAEEACCELDRYSRWRGKNPATETLGGKALLPMSLLREERSSEVERLRGWVESIVNDNTFGVTSKADLLAEWFRDSGVTPSAQELGNFPHLLAALGYGIVPDGRYDGFSIAKSEKVLVFRGAGQAAEISNSYQDNALLMRLAAGVASADKAVAPEEQKLALGRLEADSRLSQAERDRLRMLFHWLQIENPSLAGLRKTIEPLTGSQKDAIGSFLLTIAAADGRVTRDELAALQRIYEILGLDGEGLYREIHELTTGVEASDGHDPVVIRPGTRTGSDYSIPSRPQEPGYVLILDPVKIRRKAEETREVARVLAGVFAEEILVGEETPEPTEDISDGNRLGLDQSHLTLLQMMSDQPLWARSDLEGVAKRLGLPFLDAALETLNESLCAMDRAPAIDGDDPVEVDVETIKELMS
jgi:tellurite resistance protein